MVYEWHGWRAPLTAGLPAALTAGLLVVLFVAGAATAHAQSANATAFWVLTDRGNLFEIVPPPDVPTVDVVSTPYLETRRLGGLVVSQGVVAEAARYNTVGSGVTYLVDDWGRGTTYGLPDAVLSGTLRLAPSPHMYLWEPSPFVSEAADVVEVLGGDLRHANKTDAKHGERHEFRGSGKAVVHLDGGGPWYLLNVVCQGCRADTPAAVGDMRSGPWGNLIHNGTSRDCAIHGTNLTGCGITPNVTIPTEWPLDPRPRILDALSHVDGRGPILNVTKYDNATCPGAGHHNLNVVRMDRYFLAYAGTCQMVSYDYAWWDGAIGVERVLPLRGGMSKWEGGAHPAVILHLRGGSVTIQAYAGTEHAINGIMDGSLAVDHAGVLDAHSLAVIHDGYSHLGAYTISDISHMGEVVEAYPQRQTVPGVANLSHNAGARYGGLLGDACWNDGARFCITIFDNRDLPAIHDARGVIYDPRNGGELNRGGDTVNWANVFGDASPAGIPYDSHKLTLVDTYGVIPAGGGVYVEEIYVVASIYGDCSRYVDDTTTPHSWAAPPSAGWLRLKYLEGDYGGDRAAIRVPYVGGYGVACVKTYGSDDYRRFVLDDFLPQGQYASIGGTKYVYTHAGNPLASAPDVTVRVADTEITLPGSGLRVLDVVVDVAGSVTISGVVADGGNASSSNRRHACDWTDMGYHGPPRNSPTQNVRFVVDVDVRVPTDAGYRYAGERFVGNAPLTAVLPPATIGEDCRHVSRAEFEFEPAYDTIRAEYGTGDHIKVEIRTVVTFQDMATQNYAGKLPRETMHVETHLERFTVLVQ